MAEIQYRCEVAEKKRARSAWERSQEEKQMSLQKAAEEAEKRKQEEMKNLTETLTRKLRNEAALQREMAVGEALAVARVILKFLMIYLVIIILILSHNDKRKFCKPRIKIMLTLQNYKDKNKNIRPARNFSVNERKWGNLIFFLTFSLVQLLPCLGKPL